MRRCYSFPILFALMLAASSAAAQDATGDFELKVDPKDKFKLDKTAEPFRSIRDNTPLAWMIKSVENNAETLLDQKMEEAAYDLLLDQASRFTNAELEHYARRDVTFQDLIGTGRMSYKLDVIYLEGRLRQLRKADATPYLQGKGIEHVYVAWFFPKGEVNPVCFFCTELPPGIEPQKDLSKEINQWIGVAGYSFKLFLYDQQRLEKGTTTGKHVRWAAPALIGKSFKVIAEPAGNDGGMAWRTTFAPYVILGVTAVAGSLVVLAWRYRRGDRAVLRTYRGIRNENPFEDV